MAPKNPKQEALRLQQAMEAIKKMKQMRKTGATVKVPAVSAQNGCQPVELLRARAAASRSPSRKKRPAKGPPVAVKRECPSPPILEPASADSEEQRQGGKVAKRPARDRASQRDPGSDKSLFKTRGGKLPPRLPETVSPVRTVLPHTVGGDCVNGEEVAVDDDHLSSLSRPQFLGPLTKVRENGLKKHRKVVPCSGEVECVVTSRDPLAVNRKMDCQVAIDDEVDTANCSVLLTRKKAKSLKRLKSMKTSLKVKKRHAPMSIKKTSTHVKCPVFSVSLDDTYNGFQLKSNETPLLVSHKSKSDNNQSSFSVTTVSDHKLPVQESSEDEDGGTDSQEDENHVSPVDSCEEELNELSAPRNDNKFISEAPITDLSRIQFRFIGGEVILQLQHPATFLFYGQVTLEVLKGAVEVLGYTLTRSTGSQTVFCPRGNSFLPLQTVAIKDECSVDLVNSTITSFVQKGHEDDVFVLMKKAGDTLHSLIQQYHFTKEYKNLFPVIENWRNDKDPIKKASGRLQCSFYPPKGDIFQKGENWDQISQEIIESPGCTALCGGINVGKSTMLRFLVNRLLCNGNEGVVLIDFDPGQAELTVPGCVSLSIVRSPLLGPNFTHLQRTLKSIYIGDINVSNCVSRYLDACSAIISYWQSNEQLRGMPCLVNTMGFCKGIGVSIMVYLLSTLQPTRVVQISSMDDTRNYPELLCADYVRKNVSNSPFNTVSNVSRHNILSQNNWNCELHVIKSKTDKGTNHAIMGRTRWVSRDLVALSYMAQIISPPSYSILDVVPYCCSFDTLYLNICHESVPPSVTLSAFNANLVALCTVNPDEVDIVKGPEPGLPSIITKPFTSDCVGFGIVRGIDMESQFIYLLTPVPPNVLNSVNCLVLGAVSLPQAIYFDPPRESGSVPYVIQSESQYSNNQPNQRLC